MRTVVLFLAIGGFFPGEALAQTSVDEALRDLQQMTLTVVDGEFDRVFWCPLEEASGRLSFETERDVLARAQRALEGR